MLAGALALLSLAGSPATVAAQSGDTDDGRWLSIYEVMRGVIDPGTDEDFYYFSADAGMQAVLSLKGGITLDGFLILIAPDGRWLATDAAGGGGLEARVAANLPQEGVYTVIARSTERVSGGPYDLTLSLTLDRAADGENDAWLGPTDRMHGQIATNDDKDYFAFYGRPGQRVSLYMAGYDELDSYLMLIAPDGTVVATDDNNGANVDAALNVRLSQRGNYTVVASSAAGLTRGRYDLSLIQY
jgi:hypothetical protein